MKYRLLIWIGVLCSVWTFTSCDKEEMDGQDKVRLSIRTALTDYGLASRNSLSNEAMHDLRIIIQRPDGTIEHNRFLNFGAFVLQSDEILFEVVPNETKNIYLFSNAENIGGLNLADIDTKNDLDAIQNFLLTAAYDADTSLPMSAVHQVKVEKEDKVEELYIVRTACKVTLSFDNQTGETVTIGGWRFKNVADCSFLIPHINEQNWIENMVVDAENGEGTDSHWITDYDVPATVKYAVSENALNLPIAVSASASVGPVYFHETQYKPSGTEQQYRVEVKINNVYHEAVLPNLKSMVRNTHVKINATITRSDVKCQVSVYPYGEVILNPDFGL